MQQRNYSNIAAIVLILAIVSVGGYYLWMKFWLTTSQSPVTTYSNSPKTQVSNSPQPAEILFTQQDLNRIFELDRKRAGTKLYYSDLLGVGFTYFPPIANVEYNPKINESVNKIEFDHQLVEVFTADPRLSLGEAINDQILAGYNPVDCSVEVHKSSVAELLNYDFASISYPSSTNRDDPSWQNAGKCPYTGGSIGGYFLMNNEIPGKFIYVMTSQDAPPGDGLPEINNSGNTWTNSIRILK